MTDAIRILQEKRENLVSSMLKDDNFPFLERYTHIMDSYFLDVFDNNRKDPWTRQYPYAIGALGGYGRRELCLHSDLDLLILFYRKVPAEAETLVSTYLYPLWDAGFDVGYSISSVKECVSLALSDNQTLTSLLDARYVCGHYGLYEELLRKLNKGMTKEKVRKTVNDLIEANLGRHTRYGDSSALLEPNLKEGQGGLRDYHIILWIARLQSILKGEKGLELVNYIPGAGHETLREDLDFVWRVRCHLHHIAGRKCDYLYFEYQARLAEIMGYKGTDIQMPVEEFLGEVHRHMESIKDIYKTFIDEQGYSKGKKAAKRLPRSSLSKGLKVERGMLTFSSVQEIVETPYLLMKIFEESQRLHIPLSAEAKTLVRDMAYLLDDNLRRSGPMVRTFERILSAPDDRTYVLYDMLSTGLLQQFIPQFKAIAHRIQHDRYHLYPVGKHSLLTVNTVKGFEWDSEDQIPRLCNQIYSTLKKRHLLLWAALLHDIGKGEEGEDHSSRGAEIAERILRDFALGEEDIKDVVFLVREHLTMAKTATRRDINDEQTAIRLARRIRSAELLKMLYLLTIADSMATGPAAWNDWNNTLITSLFIKVLHILEKGELATGRAMASVEHKREEVLASCGTEEEREETERLFRLMSPRYLLYTPVSAIKRHIALFRRMGDSPLEWEVTKDERRGIRVLTLCAIDQPGLFSRIAGALTLNGIEILESQVYTWRNNIALDVLKVKPPPDIIREDEKWDRAKQSLLAAIRGEIDLNEALRERLSHFSRDLFFKSVPSRVNVDNESSSFFTIVEVFTYDFPGLLFVITNTLFECGQDIWVAKIATKTDQVVDIFYVRDFDGQKIDDQEQIQKIKASVLSAISSYSV